MRLRDLIGALSRSSAQSRMSSNQRNLLAGAARMARRAPRDLAGMMQGMMDLEAIHDAELETWAEPDEIDQPAGRRRFDVCDLRVWLRIAELAGVRHIPGQIVAHLEERELEILLGHVRVPTGLRERIKEGLVAGLIAEAGEDASAFRDQLEAAFSRQRDVDIADREHEEARIGAAAFAKVSSALDDLPASWMVRTHIAGSGNLKALVGTGLMHKADDTARIRPDFEIGGGWIRTGNRRVIDFADPRFLETAIGGHKGDVSYLARPWEPAARWHEGEDLHRANTPLAGPGKWPAEWRVFVQNGEVTGVANYYGWTGEGATAINAWKAIEAAALGQLMADKTSALGLEGRFMDTVFCRQRKHGDEVAARLEEVWPEGGLHCTLDFLEGDNGMTFLEGGPAHLPGGGGHPCAFAGQGTLGHPMLDVARCEGVAYLAMPHVHLGEPQSWRDGETEGFIDGWPEAMALAQQYAPLSALQAEFLRRRGSDPNSQPERLEP